MCSADVREKQEAGFSKAAIDFEERYGDYAAQVPTRQRLRVGASLVRLCLQTCMTDFDLHLYARISGQS